MPRKTRTKRVPPAAAREFAREARDTFTGAQEARELGNERLAALGVVNAAIRAADAICVQGLGQRAANDDHSQASALLRQAVPGDNKLVDALHLALAVKTSWSYGVERIRRSDLDRVFRATGRLVDEACRRAGIGLSSR